MLPATLSSLYPMILCLALPQQLVTSQEPSSTVQIVPAFLDIIAIPRIVLLAVLTVFHASLEVTVNHVPPLTM